MIDRAKLTADVTYQIVELPDDKLALVARLVRTIVETERALGTARRIDAVTLAARDRGESPASTPPDQDVRHRGSVLAAISAEVDRAIALHGRAMPGGWGPSGRAVERDAMLEAKRRCGEAQARGDVTFRDVLEEERAEVLAEIGGSQLQRAELIQEAAVCVRWIEVIDRSGR